MLRILRIGSDRAEISWRSDVEALAQRLLGVGADELGRQPGGIGGTEDGADRGAGDDLGLEAQLVEHLQHQDVGEPARPAAPQRQRDRGLDDGQRRLADLQGFAGGSWDLRASTVVIPEFAPANIRDPAKRRLIAPLGPGYLARATSPG